MAFTSPCHLFQSYPFPDMGKNEDSHNLTSEDQNGEAHIRNFLLLFETLNAEPKAYDVTTIVQENLDRQICSCPINGQKKAAIVIINPKVRPCPCVPYGISCTIIEGPKPQCFLEDLTKTHA